MKDLVEVFLVHLHVLKSKEHIACELFTYFSLLIGQDL